jgi:hypothetical protein
MSFAEVETDVASSLSRLSPFEDGTYDSSLDFDCLRGSYFPQDGAQRIGDLQEGFVNPDMLSNGGRQGPFRQYPAPSVGRYADQLIDYGELLPPIALSKLILCQVF